MQSIAEILISGGTQTQAVTAAAAALAQFSATGGADGQSANDHAAAPDHANNRIIVQPSPVVWVEGWVEFVSDTEGDLTLSVRKNSVVQTSLQAQVACQRVLKTFTPAFSPAQVNANTTAEQLLSVAGILTTDDLLAVLKPTAQAGLGIVGTRVSSADHIGVTFMNDTAAPITPTAAETYSVIVGRFGKQMIRVSGFLPISSSDSPGTISVWSDPSPANFGGTGGAPKNGVPIDLALSSSANMTLTIINSRLLVWIP